jgi:hypothetical protein
VTKQIKIQTFTMKRRSSNLLLLSGISLAGLAGGWLVRRVVAVANPPLSVESSSRWTRSHELQTVIAKPDKKWQDFAEKFSTTNSEERKTFEKNLTAQDRKAAIEALLTQGGPVGFNRGMSTTIDRILAKWAAENFEQAWAWSQQIREEGSRNFVAGKLLDILVETDQEHALNLYLELAKTYPNLKSQIPEKILASAASKNAEDFLKITGKLGFQNYNSFEGGVFYSSAKPCEFSKNFNFQEVADGVAKLLKNVENKLPLGFPTNFYDAWAERDRDAAFASFSGGPLNRLSGFHSFLGGLEKSGNPEAVWGWVAGKTQESEASSKTIRNGLESVEAVSFNGIVEALPDAASRDHFLTQFMQDDDITSGKREKITLAISAMSSPQVRLEVLSLMQKQHKQPDIKHFTDADLKAWGVTREQVEVIFSEKK